METSKETWDRVIEPKGKVLDFKLKEIWRYRNLIWMFVKRSFKAQYKQTILGPLWFIISPLLSTLIFTVVFGGIAHISTEGVPQYVFYLSGYAIWTYFSVCLTTIADTFSGNANVFGKVYFPRMTVPIANLIFSLLSLGIQIILTIIFMVIFYFTGEYTYPNWYLFAVPLLILEAGLLAMGCGIILSSLTVKYRDLKVLVGFGVTLWMYATPIVYPMSSIDNQILKTLIWINPVTPIVNNFRYAFLGCGYWDWMYFGISWAVTLVILFLGLMLFNKTEKTFMDTV